MIAAHDRAGRPSAWCWACSPVCCCLVWPGWRLRARRRRRASSPARSSASLLPWKVGVALPGTGGLPTLGSGPARCSSSWPCWRVARGRRRAPAAPVWTCGQRVEPALLWTSAGFTKPLRLVLEAILRPERAVTPRRGRTACCRRLTYRGSVPHLFDTLLYRPVVRWALALAAYRAAPAVGQSARLHGLSAAAGHRGARLGLAVGSCDEPRCRPSSPAPCRWSGASSWRRCCPA